MNRSRRLLPLAALLLLPPLASCGDLIYHEAAPDAQPVLLTLDQSLQSEPLMAAEFQAAFGTVDAVHVQLTRTGDGEVVVDEVFAAAPSDGEIRLQVEAELPEGSESFRLDVELRNSGDPLFRGGTLLTLQAGARVQPEIQLEAIAAGLAIQPAVPGPLRSLGETVALSASLVFATGDPFPPLNATWQSLDPGVVSVSTDGVVTAQGPGSGRVRASGGGFTAEVQVEVALEPASVEVEPAEAELWPGERLQLAAVVRDAGGSEISVPVEWSSSDPSVATVSAQGEVLAQEEGSATIEARAGEQAAQAAISVVLTPPVVETVGPANVGARSGRLRGRVNPAGFATQVWFEWGTDASLDDFETTQTQDLPASPADTLVRQELTGLQPRTTYYYRVVAENEIGESRGQIRSMTTLRAVAAEVEVEPSELEIFIGETAQLTAVVRDAGGEVVDLEVEWSSSDGEVASVSADGEVEGLAEGTAVIQARAGDAVGEAVVAVVLSPPLVETLEAADIGENSARVRGTVNPAGLSASAWFEVSTSPTLTAPFTTEPMTLPPSVEDESVDYQLMDLAPATTYYFRVVAENEVGVAEGETLSFNTVMPAPTNLRVEFPEGAVFFWDYDSEQFPDVLFQLEIRRVGEAGDWDFAGETEATSLGLWELEDDLTADVTYALRVRACQDTICSDWSNTLEFEATGSSPFVDTRPAIDFEGTEATVRGVVQDGGHETNFYFEWATNPSLEGSSTTPVQTVTRTGFMDDSVLQQEDVWADQQEHRVEAFLTDLTPGQTYYYIAVAENTQGSYQGFPVHSFVAGEVPAPIQDLSLSQLSYAVFVSWSWPADNGSPDFYEVERQDGTEGEWEHLTDEGPTFYDDLDVEAGVRYGYRIRACFVDEGCSELSAPEFIVFTGSGEMDTAAQETAASVSDYLTELRDPDRLSLRSPPQALRPARGWR